MKIRARVQNRLGEHTVTLTTNDEPHGLVVPAKDSGSGSAINGGELLFLALATCYCNDVYREAGKRGIAVEAVEVEVSGDFGREGEPASGVRYRARVVADASEEEIRALMQHTDSVAEIQNTLRAGVAVALDGIEAVPVTALTGDERGFRAGRADAGQD